MQRLRLYLERTGYPQTLIYLIVIAAALHSYYELWPLPGGREFVLSVMILGLAIGTILAQFLYHFPDHGNSLATISGLTIWAIFLLVNYLKLPLPLPFSWLLNLLFWMQIAICFLVVSYVPKADRDW